jgi:DNA invertase Pin-like site-specific DNA recombinase
VKVDVSIGNNEFERELIRARTGEGRERAKAKGVKMGRKPKLTDHQKREAIKRRDHGEETLAEIGRSYNVSGWTISKLGGWVWGRTSRHDRIGDDIGLCFHRSCNTWQVKRLS